MRTTIIRLAAIAYGAGAIDDVSERVDAGKMDSEARGIGLAKLIF